MKYKQEYILKLKNELNVRYHEMLRVLHLNTLPDLKDTVVIDGVDVRLAVEGFKAILAEVKKLK